MRRDVLTTWGLVLSGDPTPAPGRVAGDAAAGITAAAWFARARDAYLERCPMLLSFLEAEGAELRVTATQMVPASAKAAVPAAGEVTVGVSVIEVRPSSFDMAFRIRVAATGAGDRDDPPPPLDGRWTLVIVRRDGGERIPVPPEVRREFIAVQLAARDLC